MGANLSMEGFGCTQKVYRVNPRQRLALKLIKQVLRGGTIVIVSSYNDNDKRMDIRTKERTDLIIYLGSY